MRGDYPRLSREVFPRLSNIRHLVLERYQRFSTETTHFRASRSHHRMKALGNAPGSTWGCESGLVWLWDLLGCLLVTVTSDRIPLRGVADARHHFGDWVHLFLPRSYEQDFVP
jgi:hypothetical protein